jgi:hypothetical protein
MRELVNTGKGVVTSNALLYKLHHSCAEVYNLFKQKSSEKEEAINK